MEGKRMKDVSEIRETEKGVVIEVVDENVDTNKIGEVVERCKTGKCECMSEELKKKVSFMDFRIQDGKPIIEINGEITKEDIKSAMEKSDVCVDNCCI